jgi:hypothetical protein
MNTKKSLAKNYDHRRKAGAWVICTSTTSYQIIKVPALINFFQVFDKNWFCVVPNSRPCLISYYIG